MQCNLCDNESKAIALIEGVELSVCEDCTKFGTVIRTISKEVKEKPKKNVKVEKEKETIYLISNNYGNTIKKERENLNFTQKEFANKLSEKESLIHSIESERFEPSIELARKFERFLNITLIERYKEEEFKKEETDLGELTLGDIIKKKD
jgi:putative transcription factor